MSAHGIFRVPEPHNEPVLGYEPGSAERAELRRRLDELSSERLDIPLVIGGPEQRAIDYGTLTSLDAPVPVTLDFRKWIENILEVLPDTTHIAWVVGASPLERFWTEEFRRTSQPFTDRISFEWFNDLRFEDMLKRISQLPPHSAAFYVDLRVDAAGVPLDRDLVLRGVGGGKRP